MVEIGKPAPDFELSDADGNIHSLKEFRGKKVILYFYPKDNTSGCTKQACTFSALVPDFEKLGAKVIGISKDSPSSHRKFTNSFSLKFLLLSDPELVAIREYGVWKEKKMYGKPVMGIVRTTFVIDESGVVTHIMPKVKPDTNADDVLKILTNE